MKKFKLFIVSVIAIVCLVVSGGVFTSCSNDDDLLLAGDSQTEQVSSLAQDSVKAMTRATNSLTANELGYTPSPSSFDSYSLLSLSNYVHYNETSQTFGTCGAATYMVGRRLKYGSSYAVSTTELNNIHAGWRESLAQLYYYRSIDGVNSYLKTINAVNNIYKGRESIKQFIKEELDDGNPVMVPAIYDAVTDPYSTHAGHFYLIVGVYLTAANNTNYGGTGSIVAVKDVWCGNDYGSYSSRTMYYDYMQFLTSMWYQSQRTQGVGSEYYLALSFR